MTHEEYVQIYMAWIMGATIEYSPNQGLTWLTSMAYKQLDDGDRWILEIVAKKLDGYESYAREYTYRLKKGE